MIFLHGEKIRCVFNEHSSLVRNSIYTVNYVIDDKVYLMDARGPFLVGRFVRINVL